MIASIIEYASLFASCNFKVFPIYSNAAGESVTCYGWSSKEVDPSKKHLEIKASSDIDFIRTWPELVQQKYKRPLAGYGVVGDTAFLIDIDTKDGKGGAESYARLKRDFNIPDAEFVIKTKSGGTHLYFKKSDKFKNLEVKNGASIKIDNVVYSGVDIRGAGGFLRGPTTREWVQGLYAIVKGDPSNLSVIPDKLLVAQSRPSKIVSDVDNMIGGAMPTQSSAADLLRKGIIPDVIPLGDRDNTFYQYFCELARMGKDKSYMMAMGEELLRVTEGAKDLGFSIEAKIDSAIGTVRADSVGKLAKSETQPWSIINAGFYELKVNADVQYVMPFDNPYISSNTPYTKSSMDTALQQYTCEMVLKGDKSVKVRMLSRLLDILPEDHKVDKISYNPGEAKIYRDFDGSRTINTFKPIDLPGDDFVPNPKVFDLFKHLVQRVFGRVGSDEYTLGLDYLAWIIQKPAAKMCIAPYLVSRNRGVGKSLYADLMKVVLGAHAKTAYAVDLEGRFFNPANALCIILDEVQFDGTVKGRGESKAFYGKLKNFITSPDVNVEVKFGGVSKHTNSASYFIMGNTAAHMPIEENDRRLWVIDNGPNVLKANGYWDILFDMARPAHMTPMEREVRQHNIMSLRYYLQRHQISLALGTMRAPESGLKDDMIENSMSNSSSQFLSYINNYDNILAATPIHSDSTLSYILTQFGIPEESHFGYIKSLKSNGLVVTIQSKSSPTLKRQFKACRQISSHSAVMVERDCYLYTTRDHGLFDNKDTEDIKQLYNVNIDSLKKANKHLTLVM